MAGRATGGADSVDGPGPARGCSSPTAPHRAVDGPVNPELFLSVVATAPAAFFETGRGRDRSPRLPAATGSVLSGPRARNVEFVLGLGGVSLVIAGLVCLVLAVVPLGTGGGRPIPVPPDTAVPLPDRGLFFDVSAVLYRAVPESGPRPDERDLGCVRTGRDARPARMGVDILAALEVGDRTISGNALTPLATVKLSEGSTLTCSGPSPDRRSPSIGSAMPDGESPGPSPPRSGAVALVMGGGALAVLRGHGRGRSPLGSSTEG